ncbi:uncharacterized protein BDR25DRAFT_348393 [Lindgomyces ingoldianus]|uniref:Uncharacterized protein n=1 Tax=Lindgomyces ingoldianus TaxID=673940 RepID=A0ACB6RFX5_9PLEO|nr:uncharacterized protein BDR25DRAFT_348393 [Lindgomyces ingoldianus]KAF2478111.1 hypothetical protein BDR25DRAFT_348393 [Lindgomyces ingoldianus]
MKVDVKKEEEAFPFCSPKRIMQKKREKGTGGMGFWMRGFCLRDKYRDKRGSSLEEEHFNETMFFASLRAYFSSAEIHEAAVYGCAIGLLKPKPWKPWGYNAKKKKWRVEGPTGAVRKGQDGNRSNATRMKRKCDRNADAVGNSNALINNAVILIHHEHS